MQRFTTTHILKVTLLGIAGVLVALLVFHAGVAFGERRVLEYSRPAPGPGMPHGFFPAGHGVVGTIQSVALPSFTLKDRDGEDETVTLDASTTIEQGSATWQPANLAAGQNVVVVGRPAGAQGQMQAELVRVAP